MTSEPVGHSERALLTQPWLPPGCIFCFTGSKAVIFLTGLCDDTCYYCPVSREKLGHDVFFVNEEKTSFEKTLMEIERMGAQGASITGGDPLIKPDRTIRIIRLLKSVYGNSFHIHLYTSGRYASKGILWDLYSAGLDEIRFHPTLDIFLSRLKDAVEINDWSVGIEIPIANPLVEWAKKIIIFGERIGVEFVNLNEMEVSPSNIHKLEVIGLKPSSRKPVVESAFKSGIEIVKWASKKGLKINVHFCPASYKDSIQTRNRFRRTCFRDKKPYEKCTSDGTVLYGVIRNCKSKVNEGDILWNVSSREWRLIPDKRIISEIARKYKCIGLIEEAHPTRGRIPIVESELVYS